MREQDYCRHLTLWAMLVIPLDVSNDIRDMTAAVRTLLLNSDVTVVAQDPLVVKGKKIHEIGDIDIWTRPLSGGAAAVALFNLGAREALVQVKWSEIGLARHQRVRDLWRRTTLGDFIEVFNTTLPARGAMLLKAECIS